MFSWIVFFKKIWSNTIYHNYRGKDQSKGLGRFLFTKIIHWKNSFWCNFYLMPINLVTVLSNKRLFQSLSKNSIVFKCIIDQYARDSSRVRYLQWDNEITLGENLIDRSCWEVLTNVQSIKQWVSNTSKLVYILKKDEFHFSYAIDHVLQWSAKN